MKEQFRDFERNKPSISLEEYLSKEPKVKRASEFAQKIHEGQKRDDKVTPYYSHLEGTARIAVEELKIYDPDFVSACYLHDCIEDQGISASDIEKEFGKDVAELVEGVTQIKLEINEKPVVKVFHRSFYEPKIGLLKAACDRLHNMRTLGTARSDKRERKAQETLTYARLLESLGVWQKMIELEDLSFYQIDRKSYSVFKNLVENDQRLSPQEIGKMMSRLEDTLEKGGVKAGVDYKLNGLYRLKKKMEQKTPTFEDINDVITYTIVADSINDCFQILNLMRQEFGLEEDIKRFDDFLSNPTENGYSALQMTIMTPDGAVELTITTKEKDEFNNWGVVSLLRNGQKEIKDYSLVLSFTPDGGVKFFKPGATGVDYAYSIDPRLGARAAGLLVDGKRQDMSYVLRNGETVEVIRGEERNTAFAKDWLKSGICQPKTRRIIEEQILEEKSKELIEEGRRKIAGIVRARGLIELGDLMEIEKFANIFENFLTRIGCKGDIDKFYYQIGAGRPLEIIERQLTEFGITKENLNLSTIFISGPDHHGIARVVTAKIDDFGVNIEHQTHKIVTKNGQKTYEWRIVTEGLPQNAREKLEKNLRKVKSLGISEIIVV